MWLQSIEQRHTICKTFSIPSGSSNAGIALLLYRLSDREDDDSTLTSNDSYWTIEYLKNFLPNLQDFFFIDLINEALEFPKTGKIMDGQVQGCPQNLQSH